jgi:hypothetical protein
MPFDGRDIKEPALRRAVLCDALRGKMPNGFWWDFGGIFYTRYNSQNKECGSAGCALGLASIMWPEQGNILRRGRYEDVAEFFGMTEQQVEEIFYNREPRGEIFYRSGNPKPATVAKAIESLKLD